MKRLSVLTLFVVAVGAASTVDAQEGQVLASSGTASQFVQQPVYRPSHRRFFRRKFASRPRYTQADRIRDVRTEQFTEQYPRFIGGFHYSHFTNVGLPAGGLGFRGNGLYWTPW